MTTAWMAFFTLLVGFFTFLLWQATKNYTEVTKKLLKQSKEAFRQSRISFLADIVHRTIEQADKFDKPKKPKQKEYIINTSIVFGNIDKNVGLKFLNIMAHWGGGGKELMTELKEEYERRKGEIG